MPYKNITLIPNNVSNQFSIQQSQFYKGFSTADSSALTTKLFDFSLIQQDIINMFQTKKGERVMNPEFGTIIWELIYEPFTDDNKQLISEDVTRILNYDPRVTPTQITMSEAPYGLMIEATLYFSKQNLSEQLRISFNKEIGTITVS